MSEHAAICFDFSTFVKQPERTDFENSQVGICLNTDSEAIGAKAVEIIKKITFREPVEIKRPYHHKEDYIPKTYLILCGKNLPALEYNDGELEKHVLPIYCSRPILEEDTSPPLIDLLLRDRDAIISEAIDHLHRLYTKMDKIEQMPVKFAQPSMEPNTAIKEWFKKRVLESPNSEIAMADLYCDFENYIDSDVSIKGVQGFAQRLLKLYPNLTKSKKNNVSTVLNISLVPTDVDSTIDVAVSLQDTPES